MEVNSLESRILEKLLAGDHIVLSRLREQLPLLKVTRREFTGVGFFADFEVETPSPLRCVRFIVDDLQGECTELQAGVGFVLFVDEERIQTLEAFTYDEDWPSSLSNLTLEFLTEDRSSLLQKLDEIPI